jgi:hypothetical protein
VVDGLRREARELLELRLGDRWVEDDVWLILRENRQADQQR